MKKDLTPEKNWRAPQTDPAPYPILHPFIPDRNGKLRYFGPGSGIHAEEIKIESKTNRLARIFLLLLNQPLDLLHLTLFEHTGIVIFWSIDPFGDRSCGHCFGRKRSQDLFCGLS